MYRLLHLIKLLFLSFLILSCDNPLENRVDELEVELENQRLEQESQKAIINSLINQLFTQQAIIDSLNKKQFEYTDSVSTSLTNYIDELIDNQNNILDILISTQPETGNDYLRVDSLQICWGSGITNKEGQVVQFPVSFIELPKVFITQINYIAATGITNITTTSAKFFVNYTTYENFSYSAMGRWK